MQLFAKFKKILRRGFRATLNSPKFEVARKRFRGCFCFGKSRIKENGGNLTDDCPCINKDLHYITLHYITLHYITLHYITLHYITHYING